jgi:tRNA-dihydrouridine synthase A
MLKNDLTERRFSVAPMMDWTDRHCRVFFHRLMTRRARLYTEMLTTGAILHGDRGRLLGFDTREHPVALQLGGSEPRDLALQLLVDPTMNLDPIRKTSLATLRISFEASRRLPCDGIAP